MTENKFPELENEFIEYFEVTNLKPSESQLTLLLVLQKVGPLKIVCFLAGSFEVDPFEAGSFKSFLF